MKPHQARPSHHQNGCQQLQLSSNARTSEDILKLAALILAARLRGRRHTRYLGKEEVHPQVQRARHMSKLSKLAPSWDIAVSVQHELESYRSPYM